MGCSASTELLEMQQQLGLIQRQLATIQQQATDRGQIERLAVALAANQEQLSKGRADAQADLQILLDRMEVLLSSIQENTVAVAQVSDRSEELRTAIEELQAIANRPAPTVAQPMVLPSSVYDAATQSFRNGEYTAALVGFRSFLVTSPDSENSDNAQYWIGECHFNLGQYRDAIREFAIVRQRYPNSEKSPSVLLRSGLAHLRIHDTDAATAAFRAVMTNYPRSDEAVLANRELANLGRE